MEIWGETMEKLTNKEIGEYIRFMRKAAGLTQKQLSILMGVSDKEISRYERAVKQPPQLESFLKTLREVVVNIIKIRREANTK